MSRFEKIPLKLFCKHGIGYWTNLWGHDFYFFTFLYKGHNYDLEEIVIKLLFKLPKFHFSVFVEGTQ